ncbi:hypothetical protein [[Haemophilus] ducreyi]|uniref:hypothetical protein n=1 Tax=Haemophilus ducreyi TaxID=730 RepID=UPI000655089E|nr:hypothetical protein [[Haemophilus] ducreyi]AKO45710.1 hypothetical protein RZ66_05675 [[Haemophilus] ducreyi]AKO47096.1 hypothetical protein RZ67_05600 [[Haemophilus] ducreyi]AKO48441.1 hypothetical protein RZ68_05585 [[Haemophilus] ducreyi]AKO49826.1 hypothetical protein RZ69_05610 [[Haemophilus] ducreyi]ANF62148.1 hypothetical protein A6037_05190 [[Haemophilus] ducreyi]
MKVKCSACGAVHSLDALVANQAASDALNTALMVNGELGKALIGYLGLFRPTKTSLTFDRVAKLLNELTPMIREGKIQRDGCEFSAPSESWIYAINQMLASRQTLKLPMKSHGYLLEIIASYKPASTTVALHNFEQNRPLASSKMNAVKGALEWGTNG